MYKLMYFYVFRLVEKRNTDPKFYSAGFLFFVQIVHLGLVLALIKKVFNVQYFVFSTTYLINKLIWMPILLTWLIIIHVYYKKRFSKIEKYFSKQKVLTFQNSTIVFTLFLVPLIMMILLSIK